jgi:hypothetical protein
MSVSDISIPILYHSLGRYEQGKILECIFEHEEIKSVIPENPKKIIFSDIS